MTTLTQTTIILPAGGLSNVDLSANANIETTKIAQRVLSVHPIPFTSLRTWDAFQTLLPATPATNNLGLVTGTFGTDFLTVQTGDLKSAGSTSRKLGFEKAVPANYDAAQTIQLRVRAGMETNLADVAATIDVQVYKADGEGAVGSDLYAGAAVSVNSLTKADVDFAIDGSGLAGGDRLMFVLTFLVNDAATGTAVTGVITSINLLADTRG